MTDIPTYHVLALSGGDYCGLYTATVLAELETVLDRPIASHFDLICGTSAGGMLALGLAAEIPTQELKALFEDEGSRIFGCRSLQPHTGLQFVQHGLPMLAGQAAQRRLYIAVLVWRHPVQARR